MHTFESPSHTGILTPQMICHLESVVFDDVREQNGIAIILRQQIYVEPLSKAERLGKKQP